MKEVFTDINGFLSKEYITQNPVNKNERIKVMGTKFESGEENREN